MELMLPDDIHMLGDVLFPIHQEIEKQYMELPWPPQIQKIVIMTEVLGGRGDIVTAAKVIDLLQNINNTLIFDWVLTGGKQYNPEEFLKNKNNITIRYFKSKPIDIDVIYDLLIVGPVNCTWGIDYIQSCIWRKIIGPTFSFQENGSPLSNLYHKILLLSKDKNYNKLHSRLFGPRKLNGIARLPMGLRSGSGLFLDKDRLMASTTTRDKELIFPLNVLDDKLRDNINEYYSSDTSVNFGYAHRPQSWRKFIDCVAIHEKHQPVLIIINQCGEFDHFSTEKFWNDIIVDKIPFLRTKGYGTIIVQGKNKRN